MCENCNENCLPIELCIDPADLPGGGGSFNTWESEWFDIAPSRFYTFNHNLDLTEPWKCLPRIVGRVKTASGNWEVGEYIFGDGSNYNGSTAENEIGWVIGVSENDAHVSFGNMTGYVYTRKGGGAGNIAKSRVQCKLLISY